MVWSLKWTKKVMPVWVWVNIKDLWENSSFNYTVLHMCSHLCIHASTPAVCNKRLFDQQCSCFLFYLPYHPCLHDECARALLFDPINCVSSGVSFNYRCNSCFCLHFFIYYSSQLWMPLSVLCYPVSQPCALYASWCVTFCYYSRLCLPFIIFT